MDLDFKNKELSTHVIYLLKKNEFISSIIDKLLALSNSPLNEGTKEAWIQDILREMQSNIDSTVWNEFEIRFQQVHKDFYRKLAEKYPRICHLMRLKFVHS